MKKMIGALAMVMALTASAVNDAQAGDEPRTRFGFGFGISDDSGSLGFGVSDRDGGSFRFDYGRRQHRRPSCGRWEYRTETYLITAGGWQQVYVGGHCGGRYEWRYVAPVYGTRTVRVWVNY